MPEEIKIKDISAVPFPEVREARKSSKKVDVGFIGGTTSAPLDRLPEAYETKADYSNSKENDLFIIYRILSFHNEFGVVFREALTSELLPPFHFESVSGKHEDVTRFWNQHNMNERLRAVVDQAVTYGTGVGQYIFIGSDAKQLLNFKRIDTRSLKLKKDIKTGDIEISQSVTNEGGEAGKVIDTVVDGRVPEMVFFYQPFHNPESAYGFSAFRPVIQTMGGLSEMAHDVFAAIKNLAYNQRVMKLDLSDANTVEEKDQAIEETKKFFDRFESATNSVLVHENVHEYGFAGSVGGQTSAGGRMQPLMPIIEPALSVALIRFKIALGHFEQSGVNTQILKEQEEAMERAITPLRTDLKLKIENEIIPRILGLDYPEDETDPELIPDHDVILVWDIGEPANIRDKIDIYTMAIEFGLITPRYAAERCGFKDPYAEWDGNGFLVKSEVEQEQADAALETAEASAKAATMRPTMGKGSSVTSRQNARRNVRDKTRPGEKG